jgi:integrase/recombinase XerC
MSSPTDFIKYIQFEKRYSELTVVAYKKDLEQFEAYMRERFEDFDFETVKTKQVRRWVVELMESNVNPTSVRRKISTLKSFYKYLLRMGEIELNPVSGVILPKVAKKLPTFVTLKQLNQLLDRGYFPYTFEGRRDQVICALLYGTGIRVSELRNLLVSDVSVIENMVKVMGKRSKQRYVPYPRSVRKPILEYLDAREKIASTDVFLITNKGEPAYDRLIYRVVNKYLSIVSTVDQRSPHVLRHSFATHLLNNGAELNAIKELLGHENLAATQIYTHTSFEKLNEIYKQSHPRA